MVKALHPVLVSRCTKNKFEFAEFIYFEHFGPTSKSVRYSGLLSKAADKSSSV